MRMIALLGTEVVVCIQVLQKFQCGAFFRVLCIEGERPRKKVKEVFLNLLFCHMLINPCHCPALLCHLFDVTS